MFLGYKISLLKWQEMAKSKSALGKKINFVHNAITQKKLGEETSQIGFEKMFKPVTSKLDEAIALNWPHPQRGVKSTRKRKVKLKEIDYFPEVDPFEDMDVEGLFDEAVPSQPEKQIPAAPPTYEEIVQEVGEDPPEYEDEPPDYALEPGDEKEDEEEEEKVGKKETNQILNSLDLTNYDTAEQVFKEDAPTARKIKYLKNLVTIANFRRNQMKGYKASWTKKFRKGKITEEQKNWQHQRIDRSFKVVNEYIKYFDKKVKQMAGSGLRRKKGGTISFFSNPKELLQKLEVIVGSILAGNTNVGIRNTGVGILDLLLSENIINRSQHEKIFRKYFKP